MILRVNEYKYSSEKILQLIENVQNLSTEEESHS